MIIIGSLALARIAALNEVDAPREPSDQDCISPDPDLDLGWDRTWHPDYLNWKPWEPYLTNNIDRYATLDELYTIKVSHSYWIINSEQNWNKHIYDILWLKDRGAKLIPELHAILYPIWEGHHGKKKVDLNYDKATFFDDGVRRKYDHDSLHESVAYTPGHPLWMDFLKEGEDVAMDMAKVWAAPFDVQVKLFREEVAATALERKVIPSDYRISSGLAWKWALRRTITSLTKGRSARFMVENFKEFMSPVETSTSVPPYVDRHLANQQYLIPLEGK